MVKCPECEKEMQASLTRKCTHKHIVINGKTYVRNTTYYDVNPRCHDCNIVNGHNHTHHFGCDVERCPRCKGQIISCDCDKGRLLK